MANQIIYLNKFNTPPKNIQTKEVKMSCPLCHDTGVIETGNNDMPCSCPAGDKATFNVAGINGPISGLELKKMDRSSHSKSLETVNE